MAYKLNKSLKFNKFTNTDKKIVSNILWAVLGKVFNILNGIFIGVYIARYLGPEQYGLMNYVISYVAIFSIIAVFGFDSIEIREFVKTNVIRGQLIGTAIVLRAFLAIMAIILVVLTLIIFEKDKFTIIMILIYSSTLIFYSFNVLKNYFISKIQNEYIVKSEILRILIGALIKLVLLFKKCELEWFIFALTFDFVLLASGYFLTYKKMVRILNDWSFNKIIAKNQIKYSFPLLFSSIAIVLYQKIDQIMIKNILDVYSVGQYAVATMIIEIIIFIPFVVSQSYMPVLVKAIQKKNSDYEVKRQVYMDFVVWITIILAFFIYLFSKPIIKLLYGGMYNQAIPVLQVLTLKAVFIAFSSCSGQIIIIEDLQKFAVYRNLIGCIASISLNFLLIPKWGIIGSAFSAVISAFLSGFMAQLLIKPYRHIFKIQINALLNGIIRIIGLYKFKLT